MVIEMEDRQEPNHRVKSYVIDEDYLFEAHRLVIKGY